MLACLCWTLDAPRSACDAPISKPLARNSVRYCDTHLAACRDTARSERRNSTSRLTVAHRELSLPCPKVEKSKGRNEPLTHTDFETKIKGASVVKTDAPFL